MKKIVLKMLSFVLLFSMISVPQQLSATELSEETATISIPAVRSVTLTKEKSVTKTYFDYDDIPTSINYTEYSSGIWWSGTLEVQSTYKSGGRWYAVFKGTLYGQA